MREIRTSGLTSGDGKRGVAAWPKPPRPSSTLQINGKKRHVLVDTQGLLLCAIVHGADIQDPSRTATEACADERAVRPVSIPSEAVGRQRLSGTQIPAGADARPRSDQ